MVQCISISTLFNFGFCGAANNGKPYWSWDYKNIAPRGSLAWSPGYKQGLLGSIFGGPGKRSRRLWAGIYYDHFRQCVTYSFDQNRSFRFVRNASSSSGIVGPDDAPRYT